MTVRSIFTGLTGINAMGHGIDVIGNNIANVNTVGFRAGRATFDDIFSQTLSAGVGPQGNIGGVNPRQLGTGVSLGSIDTIFTQGNVQTTGRLLDLAIQGEGFFIMRNSNAQEVLTRAGNFTLDANGYIVDPGNGNRLLGRQANSLGQIDQENPINDLKIDFNISIPAEESTLVNAGGNLSDTEPQPAKVSNNLRGLFNRYGESLGLVVGDVLQFETGFVELGSAPNTVDPTIDLAQFNAGKGAGIILSVTANTTVEDLRAALDSFLDATVEQSIAGAQSGFDVQFDTEQGSFVFRTQNDAIQGMRLGVSPRGTDAEPPVNSKLLGEIFVNRGDPNFTKTLDVSANNTVRTEQARQANTTSSIEIFDSQGNPRTVTLGFARDTRPTEAIGSTKLSILHDRDGRQIIEGGFPPAIQFLDPVIDSEFNTATFTAYQVDNIVATQGVLTLNAGNVLIGLRLSDGYVSFNGGKFYSPTQDNQENGIPGTGTVLAGASTNLLSAFDVTSNERLNIGGGLMGDEGFTEDTTLEDIRSSMETRINSAVAGILAAITNVTTDPGGGSIFDLAVAAGEIDGLDFDALDQVKLQTIPTQPALAQPTTQPRVSVQLTSEGSFAWSMVGGNLGSAIKSETDNPDLDTARSALLATNSGGASKLPVQFDLAAQTRSIRVSTLRDTGGATLQADNSVDNIIEGGVTGFTATPFAAALVDSFKVGNHDFAGTAALDVNGNLVPNDAQGTHPGDPTGTAILHDPRDQDLTDGIDPTGLFDSGVRLVALTSGIYDNDPSRDITNNEQVSGFFAGEQAFTPVANAFNALFNSRGFGIAVDRDGDSTLDRLDTTSKSGNIPNGIVTQAGDITKYETNTFHSTGVRNNSWGFQVVLPNDKSNIPLGNTGWIDFTNEGLFNSYGGTTDAPTINFDPDGEDPVNGGVTPLSFTLNLKSMTQFGQAQTTATLLSQDGRAVGNLDSLSIAADGQILGIFTNGATRALGQVVLAQVVNDGGLIQLGDTTFSEGPNSGQPIIFNPGEGGTGTITSGQLELSNVDLATEFTNLIVTQRAFQANSRVITTGDNILQEVVNLVR